MRKLVLLAVAAMTAGIVWAAEEPSTTVLPVEVTPPTLPAGAILKVQYHWNAEKALDKDYRAFVHIRKEGDTKIIVQGDHGLPKNTSSADWQGEVQYEKSIKLPETIADGKYNIVVGFWAQGAGRAELKAGDGVKALGGNAYLAGSFTVDTAAVTLTKALAAKVTPETVAPGEPFKIEFAWDATKPYDKSYNVFVHVRAENSKDSKPVCQFDHSLPVNTATDAWKGAIRYEKTVKMPANTPDGKYLLIAGLWAKDTPRPQLSWGEGVKPLGGNSYVIGTVTVAKK